MNKNLKIRSCKTTSEITEAEQRLYALISLREELAAYRKQLDPKEKDFSTEILPALEEATCCSLRSDYARDIYNSLQAVENMLRLVLQHQATRMALCSTIDTALADLGKLISKAEVAVEKEKLMRNISAKMNGWSLDQLRAFDALVQTLHKG